MNPHITRRQALAGLGTVTLGSLLAGCGDEDARESATVEPRSTPSSASGLFDDTSACTLTAERTEGPYYLDAASIRSDCTPLADAVVDVWHCDASGAYSGFDAGDDEDERYLRGAQVTNEDGIVQFRTIYPGWYPGRTPHIHVKVHVDRQTALTTQLYFDEETNARVYARAPYEQGRDQTNASDGILGTISFDVRV